MAFFTCHNHSRANETTISKIVWVSSKPQAKGKLVSQNPCLVMAAYPYVGYQGPPIPAFSNRRQQVSEILEPPIPAFRIDEKISIGIWQIIKHQKKQKTKKQKTKKQKNKSKTKNNKKQSKKIKKQKNIKQSVTRMSRKHSR